MLQKCLWTDVLCRKGTDRKPRWQEEIELQMPETRPQPGLCTEAHCLRTGAALGLCIGPSCLHPLGLLWKSFFMLPVSSHLGNPYKRKRSSRSSLLLWGTEMATVHIAGGIWQLEIEHSPRDEKNGPTNWNEKRWQPLFALIPSQVIKQLYLLIFFNSLCYSFSISGHKCCHATKLAILSGTVRTWPCQASHVLDRKQWTRFSSSFPFC